MRSVLALYLFNGRKTVDEQMEDWGDPGPHIVGMDFIQTTYCSTFFIGDLLNHFHGDMIYFRGMYYGDWSACMLLEQDGVYYDTYGQHDERQIVPVVQYKDLQEVDFDPAKYISSEVSV